MNQQVLESTSFLARAQQNKSEVERRILELKSKRHNDAATELRETSLDIMRLKKSWTSAFNPWPRSARRRGGFPASRT